MAARYERSRATRSVSPRLFVDLRGTYGWAFDEDLLDAGRDSLDTWSAVLGLGFRL